MNKLFRGKNGQHFHSVVGVAAAMERRVHWVARSESISRWRCVFILVPNRSFRAIDISIVDLSIIGTLISHNSINNNQQREKRNKQYLLMSRRS